MSESGKAVFLSYASQDAEAAKRICEALRSAGVEVWFDAEGGLEHGDEWDAKIRRQIKECVLFIPIISANTQAREEGYFRIEWELAAQRALGIASGVAFILPVVVDGTREPNALVPDRFRTVQWTRLPGGEVSPDVRARFLKLWSHRIGVVKHEAAQNADAAVPSVRPEARKRGVNLVLIVGTVAVLALGAYFVLRRGGAHTRVVSAGAALTAPDAKAVAPLNEAQQLVAQAWEQLNKPELARAELEIADGLCRRATQLEPNSADAWAAWSQVDSWYIYHGLDFTPERREGARKKAETALHLDPKSFEARLAQACFLVRLGGGQSAPAYAAQAESLLRDLRAERPDEPRMLLILGILLRNTGKWTEMEPVFRRMAQNPNFAAQALSELGWAEGFHGDFRAAEVAANASIALQPYWANLSLKIIVALQWRGDVDLALALLQQIPASIRLEDYGVSAAVHVYTYRREPAKILEVLDNTPREWLQSNGFVGPKALLAAQAQDLAGHPEAAKLQRRNALKLVEQRLAAQPDSVFLLHLRGAILAGLGEQEETEKALRLAREMGWNESSFEEALGRLSLGHNDEALSLLERAVREGVVRNDISAAEFRLDPRMDPVRKDPRFQALLARMEADPAFSPDAPATSSAAPATSQDQKSVAVLAFANLSDDKNNEYFSDGISEELLNVLAKVPGLKVSARTSAFYFKGKEVPIPEIAQKLGVAYVVEGSVRKQGDKVRITAQLIKAADGFHVWSDNFTREMKDIFAVQDEIAGLIAKNLELKIGMASPGAAIVDPEAYQHLLRARFFGARQDNEGRLKGIEECKAALAIDPNFALAAAEMARCYIHLARFSGMGLQEAFAAARPAAELALRLNPELPDVQNAMGWVQRTADWDWQHADASFRRAYELAPQSAPIIADYAVMRNNLGHLDEAIALGRRAVELDPLNATTHAYQSLFLGWTRRFGEAEQEARRSVELNPGAVEWNAYLSRWQLLQGRLTEASASAEAETGERYRLFARALVLVARKNRPEADRLIADLIGKYGDREAAYVAEYYAFAGEPDLAFAWLEKARLHRETFLVWSKALPTLQSLHSDPRWTAFLHQIGLADDQLK